MQLLFFMDGLRYDLMSKDMPFISSLNTRPLESDFGYSCACHASMYTSRYIEDHNTWCVWKKGDNSPYKFIDYIPGLKYLNFIPVKMVLSRVARLFSKNDSFSGIPMLVNLPLKYWSMFETCENKFWNDDEYMKGKNTLFKILKNSGFNYEIVGLNKKGDVFEAAPQISMSENDVVYYFIGQVDGIMHSKGAVHEETHKYLKMVDNFVKREYEKALEVSKEVSVICWSDHGHIDVDKKIDINEYFRPHNKNVNKYIHLIESTFARFWFRNEREKEEVSTVLHEMEKLGLGFIFTEETYKRWHMRFNSNEHGEMIFHLNAPNSFTNTIWGFGHRYVSMHGYYPELSEHKGIFASNKAIKDEVKLVTLVDILPTIIHDLGLEESSEFVGRNILE